MKTWPTDMTKRSVSEPITYFVDLQRFFKLMKNLIKMTQITGLIIHIRIRTTTDLFHIGLQRGTVGKFTLEGQVVSNRTRNGVNLIVFMIAEFGIGVVWLAAVRAKIAYFRMRYFH